MAKRLVATSAKSAGRIRVGCSGWSYVHWRGVLYPRHGSSRDWLDLYAARFDTVEVNASFYRLPSRQMVERWADRVPPGFCFAVKASRYLTHVRRLRAPAAGVALLEERLAPLSEKSVRGPVLWQTPPDFHRDEGRLRDLLDALPPGRHAIEFRHGSWFADNIYALLQERGVALVVADRSPAETTPWVETADWWYVRLHNGRGRRGRYTDRQLADITERLCGAAGDVYCYFNNDWEGFAVENAHSLRRMLGRAGQHLEEADAA